MPRPKYWPYVTKRSTGRPRLSKLSLRDNKLILDSKELTGVKNYELKSLETTPKFSELKITLLVKLIWNNFWNNSYRDFKSYFRSFKTFNENEPTFEAMLLVLFQFVSCLMLARNSCASGDKSIIIADKSEV